jgi:hypothetical protein
MSSKTISAPPKQDIEPPDEEMFLGILSEDGTIQVSDYQLKNIHEFLVAFCQPNIHEDT